MHEAQVNINEIKPHNFVIFGAKGDLASRKLIPALYKLEKYNYLNIDTKIIGVGRANWNNQDYINIVLKSLKKFSNQKIQNKYWNKFKNRLLFCNLDVTNIKNFIKLKNILCTHQNINIYYFAIPPNIFGNICQGLGQIKLNLMPNKIIVEKPIGTSLNSSKIIHNELNKYFQENQIFRIDHYLGKETILNLLSLRFSNSLFYHNWDRNIIEFVKITIAEEIGIEGRWGYFDKIGQMRDMVQNHLLQILSIVAMSPPKNLNFKNIRNEKIKVLQALRKINIHNIQKNIVKGQYAAGKIHNKFVPAYINEQGANKNSDTETFVAIKVNIDNDRWKGVPFYLQTGKRLSNKISEIIISFKEIPKKLFHKNTNNFLKNQLKIRLQPNEGIEIQFLNKKPNLNSEYILENKILNFNYHKNIDNNCMTDEYERLLLEIMKNNQSLFVSREEIEESWYWVDSIIQAWSKIKPELYPSGTWGPESSKNIIQ